ncbi:LamG-like jellyroll fold domain-containing protein, partial [Patescibacteria group bacterium]
MIKSPKIYYLIAVIVGILIIIAAIIISSRRYPDFSIVQAEGCISPPSNLIGWWDADLLTANTAHDRQGGQDGTLVSGATTATGKVGNAFSFDGVDDYLNIPNTSGNYSSTTGTWDFWFQSSMDVSSRAAILLAQHSPSGSVAGISIFLDGTGFVALQIKNSAGATLNMRTTQDGYNDGTWHHVALVFDGSTVANLYVDGALADTGTPPDAWAFYA